MAHDEKSGYLPKTLLLVGFRIDISYRQKNNVKTATYKEYVESAEQARAKGRVRLAKRCNSNDATSELREPTITVVGHWKTRARKVIPEQLLNVRVENRMISKRPLLEAITVYLVSFIGAPLVYGVFSSTLSSEFLKSHAFVFGGLFEFLLVGFLCILFAILDHDNRITYGLTRKGLVKSLLIGFALIVVQSSICYALGIPVINPKLDAFTQSLAQPSPYSIGFALFCGFAYGPLQVFFSARVLPE